VPYALTALAALAALTALTALTAHSLWDQVPYAELPMLLASTRVVLVPDDDQGGGERLVLEARAAGATVELAPDNNKVGTYTI
jgi:hypothetical protein